MIEGILKSKVLEVSFGTTGIVDTGLDWMQIPMEFIVDQEGLTNSYGFINDPDMKFPWEWVDSDPDSQSILYHVLNGDYDIGLFIKRDDSKEAYFLSLIWWEEAI